MTSHTLEVNQAITPSPLITARLAGFFYLLQALLGIFALLYVSSRLEVPGDAAATINNIIISESLFRLGIVSTFLIQIVGICYDLLLYKLLKPVNKNIAALMLAFTLSVHPIQMLNELTHIGVLQLLSGADYLTVFTTEQVQALAYLFLRLHDDGTNIAFIFAGLWLLPLGYLVFKSGFFPRILGILLFIAGCGYLIDVFGSFLSPTYNLGIGLFTGLAEIVFLLWLLIKGVNVEQWKKRALESA